MFIDPILATNLVKNSFRTPLERAGLPRIRFHDLRHTAATLLFSQYVPAKVTQERLGHSQISITMDIYSHVMPGMQEDATAKLDKLFPAQEAN